ncbi:MAG: VanZ family protein [Deltaproteobacteria bacterium]|nr:VanZ family protein [Deltaproteobacteria bacterium]
MPSHFFRHNLDKLGHLVLFALLGVLYHGVASRGFRVVTPWRMGLGFGAIALFGGLDELSQIYIPYRSADWKDWAMDVLGGFVATLIAALWAWRKAQRT